MEMHYIPNNYSTSAVALPAGSVSFVALGARLALGVDQGQAELAPNLVVRRLLDYLGRAAHQVGAGLMVRRANLLLRF
ncbi:hypothetical protein [Janthinobacterium fluminis]|uniref:Uncharacterized protein n=1 Tax=Janthinobacterium fluminis TaxID=2987524 RepID=A0ABT5K3R0_9BURK|nr:hypothetical protein [Janthinobacterium fluminis]MDC8759043.1 hypothetical protein [Janthinobacterium fluminis]